MNKFTVEFEVKWADVDPNMHLRHTVFLDFADQARIRFFNANGLTFNDLVRKRVGPIIFSTKSNFMAEVLLSEKVSVDCNLLDTSTDGRKWKIKHHLYKEDGRLAAEMEYAGAWLDLDRRKVAAPPQEVLDVMQLMDTIPVQ